MKQKIRTLRGETCPSCHSKEFYIENQLGWEILSCANCTFQNQYRDLGWLSFEIVNEAPKSPFKKFKVIGKEASTISRSSGSGSSIPNCSFIFNEEPNHYKLTGTKALAALEAIWNNKKGSKSEEVLPKFEVVIFKN